MAKTKNKFSNKYAKDLAKAKKEDLIYQESIAKSLNEVENRKDRIEAMVDRSIPAKILENSYAKLKAMTVETTENWWNKGKIADNTNEDSVIMSDDDFNDFLSVSQAIARASLVKDTMLYFGVNHETSILMERKLLSDFFESNDDESSKRMDKSSADYVRHTRVMKKGDLNDH